MNDAGRIVSPSFLDNPRLRRLLAALDGEGEEVRVVGGAIRNHLMNIPVTEIDLTTTASPDTTIARAKAAGLKSVPTGLEHGTVTIIVDHVPFEVTTLRQDVETDGRRAKVAFGRNFRDDALRRDFTCNALSVRADGAMFDYTDGRQDIDARHVRFIGPPCWGCSWLVHLHFADLYGYVGIYITSWSVWSCLCYLLLPKTTRTSFDYSV